MNIPPLANLIGYVLGVGAFLYERHKAKIEEKELDALKTRVENLENAMEFALLLVHEDQERAGRFIHDCVVHPMEEVARKWPTFRP